MPDGLTAAATPSRGCRLAAQTLAKDASEEVADGFEDVGEEVEGAAAAGPF